MKSIIFSAALALFILILSTGCQKEVPPNVLGDSTHTASGKVLRKITIHHPAATDSFSMVVSLQYDTAQRKISYYLQDSIFNSDDFIGISYQFDANGYLAGASLIKDNGTTQPDFTVFRNSNEQIQKIIEFDAEELNGISYNDTIYYSYEQSAGQTIVQDSGSLFGNGFFVTYRTVYNAQNEPVVMYFDYPNSQSYSFDNGMVSDIINPNDTTHFTYDNTPIAKDWESLPSLLLGKDHYLFEQPAVTTRLNYHFLSFIIEPDFETVYNPLLTHPLATITVKGHPLSNLNTVKTKSIHFTTTYTADKLPAMISVFPEGDDPFYYTFEYQ